VLVAEPTVEDTIAILRGLKGRYEAHHKVQIADAALVAAATLSDRYITSRFLPDKAIDLVDESASRLRMEIDSSPVEIDELQRSVDRLKMEELALDKETDAASRERLEKLRRDLADKEEELRGLTARWEKEKQSLNRVGELKEKLDELRGQAERAQRDGDFDTASKLLYGEIPALERDLEAASEAEEEAAKGTMVKEEVGSDDIADVVASWRARHRSCCAWRRSSAAGSSARRKRSRPSRTPYAAPARASPTPTARPARSSSSARPASARPSWPRPSPTSCSTTSGRWSAST
jgi:ATP-dependent Clp protease ATP-binding subunit ClpB